MFVKLLFATCGLRQEGVSSNQQLMVKMPFMSGEDTLLLKRSAAELYLAVSSLLRLASGAEIRDGCNSLDDQGSAIGINGENGIGFFESGVAISEVPQWADWFLELGLNFPAREIEARRSILIVTTPCDTPAAGLIALGVVLRDLARESATDEAGHTAAIRAWATQYLTHCQSCRYKCKPQVARCGYEMEASGLIHAPPKPGRKRETTLQVHSMSDEAMVLADSHGCRDHYSPTDRRHLDLRPDGWPHVARPENRPPIAGNAFKQLKPNWSAISRNLGRSYGGACFVGRRTGKEATREVLDGAGFILEGHQYPLSAMLTIEGWGEDSVSRLRYVSTRGGACQFDRTGPSPEIAIIDGAAELAAALNSPQLRGSSLITVVSRDTPQDKMDDAVQSLYEAANAYVDMPKGYFDAPPPGISILWKAFPA